MRIPVTVVTVPVSTSGMLLKRDLPVIFER